MKGPSSKDSSYIQPVLPQRVAEVHGPCKTGVTEGRGREAHVNGGDIGVTNVRTFRPAELEGAVAYVRDAAASGVRRVWIESVVDRRWTLAYGGEPEAASRYLTELWCGGEVRVRVSEEV